MKKLFLFLVVANCNSFSQEPLKKSPSRSARTAAAVVLCSTGLFLMWSNVGEKITYSPRGTLIRTNSIGFSLPGVILALMGLGCMISLKVEEDWANQANTFTIKNRFKITNS